MEAPRLAPNGFVIFRKPPMQCFPKMSNSNSSRLLAKQLRELNKNPVQGFSAGLFNETDLYAWEIIIMFSLVDLSGPENTAYEGGFFKARLDFPEDYPQVILS